MKRKLTVVLENHFDQIWRRCFRRDFEWRGTNFISYSKIQQYYIDRHLENWGRDSDYCFSIETPCTVETYLERNPEKEALLKKLYADGIAKTMNTGYVIIDSNMIHPEAIIRNYLISDAFFKEFGGKTPKIANRSDAFGNSAQLPQILRGFGAEHVIEIYYNKYDEEVWVGLDQTAISVKKTKPLGGGGGWFKYPPCKECKGFGQVEGKKCQCCDGKGLDFAFGEPKRHRIVLFKDTEESGAFRVGGEELLPDPHSLEQVRLLAEETGHDISIGHWDSLLETFKEEIEKVSSGDFSDLSIHPSPEFNPNTTGGYITHILIKQNLSRVENLLLAAETLEAFEAIGGKKPHPFDREWKAYLLCAFHDSSAGTVVDQAYEEIMDYFAKAEEPIRKRYALGEGEWFFNPTSAPFEGVIDLAEGRGQKVGPIPPYSFEKIEIQKEGAKIKDEEKSGDSEQFAAVLTDAIAVKASLEAGESQKIENEFFRVEFDQRGIRSIFHKQKGMIADWSEELRPLEWVYESDVGSAWATLEMPTKRLPLSERTKFIGMEQTEEETLLRFCSRVPLTECYVIGKNTVEWSVSLIKGYDRLRIHAEVDWESADKRLKLCFPLAMQGRDVYGIPGGHLERAPYEPEYKWNGANGDWPAYYFAGVEGEEQSVALFHRGTPAYRITPWKEGRLLEVSVLRSPTLPVCLHEPDCYTMTEWDGLRDMGHHTFDFELAVYDRPFAKSRVFIEAEQFARPLLRMKKPFDAVEMPQVLEGSARITHIKPSEDGRGVILRLSEEAGEATAAILSLPAWVKKISRAKLNEQGEEEMKLQKEISLELRAFELATLRLEF